MLVGVGLSWKAAKGGFFGGSVLGGLWWVQFYGMTAMLCVLQVLHFEGMLLWEGENRKLKCVRSNNSFQKCIDLSKTKQFSFEGERDSCLE